MSLPCLTLHQPYASLIAERVKWIETRSWRAPEALVGEYIGIHAAVTTGAEWSWAGGAGWWYDAGRSELSQSNENGCVRWVGQVPLGAIVATARLTACVPMVEMADDMPDVPELVEVLPDDRLIHWPEGAQLDVEAEDWTDQLPYGDFAPGRWAWLLDDIAPTTERCPGCMGEGHGGLLAYDADPYYLPPSMGGVCAICDGAKACDRVPAKGRQRVWRWTP